MKNVGFNSGGSDRDFCFPVAFFPHRVASAAGIANLRQEAALHLFASLRLRVRLDVLDGAAENRRSSDVKANALGDDGVPRSVPWLGRSTGPVASRRHEWTHPVTGDTVGIVYCTTHAEKKVRNNLHKSFYSTAKRRLLVPPLTEFGETDGAPEPASWQAIVDVVEHFKDSGPDTMSNVRRLTDEVLLKKRTSWAKMKVAYARVIFSPETIALIELAGQKVRYGEGTRRFVSVFYRIFAVLRKTNAMNDHDRDVLRKGVAFLTRWQAISRGNENICLASQTMNDLMLSMKTIIKWFDETARNGRFVVPHRLTQDCVESYFSSQRFLGGCGSNPTCEGYLWAARKQAVTSDVGAHQCISRAKTNVSSPKRSFDVIDTMRSNNNAKKRNVGAKPTYGRGASKSLPHSK